MLHWLICYAGLQTEPLAKKKDYPNLPSENRESSIMEKKGGGRENVKDFEKHFNARKLAPLLGHLVLETDRHLHLHLTPGVPGSLGLPCVSPRVLCGKPHSKQDAEPVHLNFCLPTLPAAPGFKEGSLGVAF